MCIIVVTTYLLLTLVYTTLRFVRLFPAANEIKLVLLLLMAIGVMRLPIEAFLEKHGELNFSVQSVLAVLSLFSIMILLSTVVWDILRLFKVSAPFAPQILVAISFIFAVYGYIQAMRVPTVEHYEIASEKLGKDFKPYKIAHLSDIHIGSGFTKEWLQRVVDKTNAENADLVVITGDLIDGMPDKLLPELEPLKALKQPVYIISGNHEYYYGKGAWDKAFKDMGLIVLKNENVVIDKKLVLGGTEWGDHHVTRGDLIEKTFAGAPEGLPKILLAHYPAAFDAAAKQNVFLTLSGHTHGGMLFPLSLAVRFSNAGYLKGLYQKDGNYMNLSQGTGLWGGFAARIGTNNEISIITLKNKGQ